MNGRVQIKSDGTPSRTFVMLDGDMLPGITRIEFVLDAHEKSAPVILHFGVVDIEVEAEIKQPEPIIMTGAPCSDCLNPKRCEREMLCAFNRR